MSEERLLDVDIKHDVMKLLLKYKDNPRRYDLVRSLVLSAVTVAVQLRDIEMGEVFALVADAWPKAERAVAKVRDWVGE